MKKVLMIVAVVALGVVLSMCGGEEQVNTQQETSNESPENKQEALNVLYTIPKNGETNVSITTPVNIFFPSPITNTNSVVCAIEPPVSYNVQWISSTQMTIPHSPFTYSSTYTIGISNFIDIKGRVLSHYIFSFTTESNTNQSDSIPPAVVSTSPSNGETNVGLSQSIVIEFSEPILNTNEQNVWITPALSLNYSWSANSKTLTLSHSGFGNNTSYTVSVSNYTDYNTNKMTPYVFTFQTTNTNEGNSDSTPPSVSSTTPPAGATDVALNQSIIIVFSEPISNTNEQNVGISPDVSGTSYSWSPDSTTLTISHNGFSNSTSYTVAVSNYCDTNDNVMNLYSFSFTTTNTNSTGGGGGENYTVYNPSFEEGETGWQIKRGSVVEASSLGISAKDGSKVLLITNLSTYNTYASNYSHMVSITEGEEYIASVWIHAIDDGVSNGLRIAWYDATSNKVDASSAVYVKNLLSSSGWVQTNVSDTAPSGAHFAIIELRGKKSGGRVAFDLVKLTNRWGENLTTNPSFESGTNGWHLYSDTQLITTNSAFDGTNILKISNLTSSYKIFATNIVSIPVVGGKNYRISIMALAPSSNPSNTVKGGWYVSWRRADSSQSDSDNKYTDITNNGIWTEVSAVKTAPSDATHLIIQIKAKGGSGNNLWVDSVSVRQEVSP